MANRYKKIGVIKSCMVCQKDIYIEPSQEGRKKFCSKKCLYESGIQTKTFQKGHPKSFLGQRIHTQETKDKISLNSIGKHNGDKAWNWIEDRTKVKTGDRFLNDPLQKQWRKEVKDRDDWKCMISDESCNGRLEAHHILPWSQYPELRHEVKNGITLCHYHHPRKSDEVVRLAPDFTNMVNSLLAN